MLKTHTCFLNTSSLIHRLDGAEYATTLGEQLEFLADGCFD